MTAESNGRKPMKIRRRGKHARPSQVEKAALEAGKAAPAVALMGALIMAPQAQHAFVASARPTATATQSSAHGGTQVQAAIPDAFNEALGAVICPKTVADGLGKADSGPNDSSEASSGPGSEPGAAASLGGW